MRIRVTFAEQMNRSGEPIELPQENLARRIPEGAVLDQVFVERTAPQAMHNEESLEEDDNFLSRGSETWEYTVANQYRDQFLAEVQNSTQALDCVVLDETDAR